MKKKPSEQALFLFGSTYLVQHLGCSQKNVDDQYGCRVECLQERQSLHFE